MTTWKFLVEDSKHTLVSYELISKLSEIEKYEVLVQRYNEILGDLIFQPGFFDNPRLKNVCYILFSDFAQTEQNFIEALADFNSYALSQLE
jgi:hypothetical protein